MKIYMDLFTMFQIDEDMDFEEHEIAVQEFYLNFVHQVPHWHYLTNEGISFFKGEPLKDWKS